MWLNLQVDYDMRVARGTIWPAVELVSVSERRRPEENGKHGWKTKPTLFLFLDTSIALPYSYAGLGLSGAAASIRRAWTIEDQV